MAELTKLYDSLCAQYLMALHRRTCLCSVLNHTIFEWLFNSIFPPVICYFNSRSATWIGYYIFFSVYIWCFVDFSLKLCWCDQYLILLSLLSECDVYKHLVYSVNSGPAITNIVKLLNTTFNCDNFISRQCETQ